MKQPTILAPLDGSSFGEFALPIALGLARSLDGKIKLISVASEDHAPRHRRVATVSPDAVEPVNRAAVAYLNNLGRKIADRSDVPVFTTVVPGTAAKGLVDFLGKSHPELIVMSTHGRGSLSRAWVGSVADWVIRHTSVPVMLVRPEEDTEVAIEDTHRFRNLMIALDGSEQAEAGLEWAQRIGRASGAMCTLIQVTSRSFPIWSSDLERSATEEDDYAAIAHSESLEYLHRIEFRLRERGLSVTSEVERDVPAATGILRKAEERKADLIVITTHGRGRLPRFILGSVADKVVRAAHVPVLVIRPTES